MICVDEKTAIGARSRKHPEQRVAPGRAGRREFEYIRHGTISIIAALDVHSGEVSLNGSSRTTRRPSSGS